MTSRQRLQYVYELAFYPPEHFAFWRQLKRGEVGDLEEAGKQLDDALRLHLALPETGYGSQRALARLALYQARARAFGLPARLRGMRRALGRPELEEKSVPPGMVRDIAIPPIARRHDLKKKRVLES